MVLDLLSSSLSVKSVANFDWCELCRWGSNSSLEAMRRGGTGTARKLQTARTVPSHCSTKFVQLFLFLFILHGL